MLGTNNTLVWIVYTQYSNEYKLRQFRETRIPGNLTVQFIDADELQIQQIAQHAMVCLLKGKQVKLPDVCFSLVVDRDSNVHGYEILEKLESVGVRVVNSISSIDAVSDKYSSGKVIQSLGYPYPMSFIVSRNHAKEIQKREFDYPFVLKPVHGRKSRGVQIIHSDDELKKYFSQYEFDAVLVQEFIADSFRRDIRAYVLGGKVIGALRRTARAKTFSDVFAEKIILSKNLEERSVKIASEFGLDFCCIDYFADENNTVCEVNAFPGFLKYDAEFQIPLSQEIYNYLAKNDRFESE